MGADAVLRFCLVTLGAFVFLVEILTSFSLKKMMVTYIFGILGIAGVVLPNWEFLDRDFKECFSPMPVHGAPSNDQVPRIGRFKFYPPRVALITTIYSHGPYKWWMNMSS